MYNQGPHALREGGWWRGAALEKRLPTYKGVGLLCHGAGDADPLDTHGSHSHQLQQLLRRLSAQGSVRVIGFGANRVVCRSSYTVCVRMRIVRSCSCLRGVRTTGWSSVACSGARALGGDAGALVHFERE